MGCGVASSNYRQNVGTETGKVQLTHTKQTWIVSCFPDSFYSICCFVVAHNGVNLFKPNDIFTSSQLDQYISVLRVGGWDRLHFSGRSSAILF